MTVKELKEYKGARTADLNRDLSEFEKNFILIASGMLAFSITFIKDIVKLDQSICILLLFIGWLLIGVSIGLMMYAWLYSSNKCHELWKIADQFINENKLFIDDDKILTLKGSIDNCFSPAKKALNTLRQGAIGSFLLGISSLAIFIGTNIINERALHTHLKPTAYSIILTNHK